MEGVHPGGVFVCAENKWVAAKPCVSVENKGTEVTHIEHLQGLVCAQDRGFAAREFVSISKQTASVLRGADMLSAGENSEGLASSKASRVPGMTRLEQAAASCRGRSLAANMNYYNIRVNVISWFSALWLKSCAALCARYSSCGLVQYPFDFCVQLASYLQRGGICIGG